MMFNYLEVQRDPRLLEKIIYPTAVSRNLESHVLRARRAFCYSVNPCQRRLFTSGETPHTFLPETLKFFPLISAMINKGLKYSFPLSWFMSVYYKLFQETLTGNVSLTKFGHLYEDMSSLKITSQLILLEELEKFRQMLLLCYFCCIKLSKCSYTLDMTVIFQYVLHIYIVYVWLLIKLNQIN